MHARDTNDAEAICTAVQQRNIRFVPKKTLEQQESRPSTVRASVWSIIERH
jgi:hypothetical protein